MAMTNTQRATLYTTLAETIGPQEAETLMEQLPPSGWDQVATKDDLRVLGANFAAALAETNAAIIATNAAMTAGFAETNAAIKAGLAEAGQGAGRDRQEPGQAALHRHGHDHRGHRVDLDSALHQRRSRLGPRRPLEDTSPDETLDSGSGYRSAAPHHG